MKSAFLAASPTRQLVIGCLKNGVWVYYWACPSLKAGLNYQVSHLALSGLPHWRYAPLVAGRKVSAMRFCLLDRITQLEPGVRITAIKQLRADEDYLADHFPRFPVMPGVLMLETMFQAGMWLVRQSEGFEHSIVVLKEARNVKYSDFVEPGQTLEVSAEFLKQDGSLVTLKTQGTVDGKVAVNARLILDRYNLAERHPSRTATDPYVNNKMRAVLAKLLGKA